MNDLLSTVKSKRRGGKEGGKDENELYEGMEAGFTPPVSDAEQAMQDFFRKVEEVKTDMGEIKSLQKEIVTLHEKGKTIVKTKEIQKHQEDIKVGRQHKQLGVEDLSGRELPDGAGHRRTHAPTETLALTHALSRTA